MIKDNSTKELFEYIRTVDVKELPPLKEILSTYSQEKISIEQLFESLKISGKNSLLIDARSEKEFEESSLPSSLNFPVLNTSERHNVGLIYKKFSQTSALWLAMQYADPKREALQKFLSENNADKKNIYVYCWRGGGRSGYLSKMISGLGYKVVTLTGGQKSFRKTVNDFFSKKIFPYELLELSGLTGSGKTELLQTISDKLPVIDLEFSAKHYSSLLGHIPYEIKNYKPVQNQAAFENDIYSQIYFGLKGLTDLKDSTHSKHSALYLIESESKHVGRFQIPKMLYDKLQTAPTVRIISSLDNRVNRIVRDYFGDKQEGIEPMKKVMTEKGKFFKQQLSNKVYEELMSLLDQNRVEEFSEIMMTEYYDKKYKDKGKKPIAVITTDDLEKAKQELIEIFKSI